MKKKAFFIVSQKGGVGKTTFSRALLDYLRRQEGPRSVAFDADPKIAQLAAAYGLKDGAGEYDPAQNLADPFGGVIVFDVRDEKRIELMANALDMNADLLLFDMPGGSIDDMRKLFGNLERFIDEYRSMDYEIIVCMVINHLFASARNIETVLDLWGDDVKYVVVKNLGQAKADEFVFFDGADMSLTKRAGSPAERIKKLGGIVIDMPELPRDTYAMLDADALPFSQAAEASVSSYSRTHRSRIGYWMKDMDAQLEKLGLMA